MDYRVCGLRLAVCALISRSRRLELWVCGSGGMKHVDGPRVQGLGFRV